MFTLFVSLLILQRLAELALSRRNGRRLLARGAVEAGRGHYPVMVAVHVAFYVCLVLEHRSWSPHWQLWLSLLLLAQLLRLWVLRTLGPLWTTRILVLPGSEPVRAGPYRFQRHPNYLAVVIEIFSIPMLAGAYWTAAIFSLLNALVLFVRIREEEKAMARWMRWISPPRGTAARR